MTKIRLLAFIFCGCCILLALLWWPRTPVVPSSSPTIDLGSTISSNSQLNSIKHLKKLPPLHIDLLPDNRIVNAYSKIRCSVRLEVRSDGAPAPTFLFVILRAKNRDFLHEPMNVTSSKDGVYLLERKLVAPATPGKYQIVFKYSYLVDKNLTSELQSDSESSSSGSLYHEVSGPELQVRR